MSENIEQVTMADFSGGYVPDLAATDFSERQWAQLKGFVLESETSVRSQWAQQQIGTETGFDELGSFGDVLVARKPDGTFWWRQYVTSGQTAVQTKALTWTQIPTTSIPADVNLHILCAVPLKNESSSGFKTGLLINGRDRSGSAFAAYWLDGTGVVVKEWTKKWPDAVEGPTDNMMPPANKAAMWGSFLILGDVRWFNDDTVVMSDTNNKPYPSALWFSVGGDIDRWNPLDLEPMEFGGGAIGGIVDIDTGLLVTSGKGMILLRGTGDSYNREPLRMGVGPSENTALAWWPHTGSVAFVDTTGQAWLTDSVEFIPLTTRMKLDRDNEQTTQIHAFHEFLILQADGKTLCFRAFDVDGAFTELIPANGEVKHTVKFGDQLYYLDAAGTCWRFNRRSDLGERGQIDGADINPVLSTRTMDRLDGHEVTFWHRFGARHEGTGTCVSIALHDGPALAPHDTLTWTLNEPVAARHDVVVPGHGPTLEAAATVTYKGDVEVEQCAWWAHRGRAAR